MITLAVPYDAPVFTFQLPNPKLGDSLGDDFGFSISTAMDGSMYTNIKRNPNIRLVWNFRLSECAVSYRNNILTLISTYASEWIKITGFNSVQYRVKCVTNPVEFSEDKNYYECVLEFRGTEETP